MNFYGGMFQICEACGEYEWVEGTVVDFGGGDYELNHDPGLAWTTCPSCGTVLNGDTDEAQLSWSLFEPDAQGRSRARVVLDLIAKVRN